MVTADHREAIAEVLCAHREDALTCYDHAPTPDRPVWCCVCGAHELTVSWRAHLADALLGSDVLEQIRAEARAEALREAAEFIEVTAGIGTNDSTYANGWYAALGYALDELRDRAEGSV